MLQREQVREVWKIPEVKVEKVIFEKSKPEQIGEHSGLHTITKDKYSYNSLEG